jgi:iron(III) transport system substrate-binding protein
MRLFLVAGWLSSAVSCIVCAPAFAQGELAVVCSVPIPWCEAVAAVYLKETGISVNITVKDAGDALSQLAAERATPKHDVWFAGAGESHLRAAEIGLLQEYRSPLLPNLHDWAVRQAEDSHWRSVGLYAGVLGIGYNSRSLEQKRLREPKCWSDLGKPEYRGEVQMANPISSRTGYIALVTLVQILGEDPAFDLLKGLHRNVRTYPRTGGGAIRAASRGETTIGVTLLHDAMTEIVNGFSISLVLPCEGTGYEIEAMSIVAGAPHMADAKRFYDWALTPAAQRIAGDSKNFHVPSNKATRVSTVIASLGDLRLIRFDFQRYFAAAERKRLLEKWDREVNAMQR